MSVISQLLTMGPALVPAIGALGGAVSGSKFIQEGERGLKSRFGKVIRTRSGTPKMIKAGFAFVIPKIEQLHRTHVRVRTVNLATQEVMLTDGMEFEVGGLVRFHVIDTPEDVYAALFETISLNRTVGDYVSGKLRDALSELTYTQVLARETVTRKVTDDIREQLREWGLGLIEFSLSDCSPTPPSARAILIGAETRMRAAALVEVADKLGGDLNVGKLPPTVAAALIGTPVATSLDGRARMKESEGSSS